MFCYKCGCEIPDESQFCFKCGAQLNNVQTQSVTNRQSNEFSKDALKIYFSDLLTFECIKNKLQGDLKRLKDDITTRENNNFYQYYYIFTDEYNYNRYLHLYYDGEDIKFAACKGASFCHTVNGYSANLCEELNYKPLLGLVTEWLSVEGSREIFETTWQYDYYPSMFRFLGPITKTDKGIKEACLDIYDEFKKIAPIEYEKNIQEINKLNVQYDEMTKELEKASRILEQAYDINIVPKQFRDLYAVYYLADFITTSNESLSTALLNYNLEIIKEKLDKIIDQQQEIIINQALAMVQNEKIMKQNEANLQHLASIEQNTERAAQYAQIAANNAEACAWIGIANYINKK